MERYMAHLLKGAEYRTRQFMGSQVKNPASLQYGGIKGIPVDDGDAFH